MSAEARKNTGPESDVRSLLGTCGNEGESQVPTLVSDFLLERIADIGSRGYDSLAPEFEKPKVWIRQIRARTELGDSPRIQWGLVVLSENGTIAQAAVVTQYENPGRNNISISRGPISQTDPFQDEVVNFSKYGINGDDAQTARSLCELMELVQKYGLGLQRAVWDFDFRPERREEKLFQVEELLKFISSHPLISRVFPSEIETIRKNLQIPEIGGIDTSSDLNPEPPPDLNEFYVNPSKIILHDYDMNPSRYIAHGTSRKTGKPVIFIGTDNDPNTPILPQSVDRMMEIDPLKNIEAIGGVMNQDGSLVISCVGQTEGEGSDRVGIAYTFDPHGQLMSTTEIEEEELGLRAQEILAIRISRGPKITYINQFNADKNIVSMFCYHPKSGNVSISCFSPDGDDSGELYVTSAEEEPVGISEIRDIYVHLFGTEFTHRGRYYQVDFERSRIYVMLNPRGWPYTIESHLPDRNPFGMR